MCDVNFTVIASDAVVSQSVFQGTLGVDFPQDVSEIVDGVGALPPPPMLLLILILILILIQSSSISICFTNSVLVVEFVNTKHSLDFKKISKSQL